MKSVTNTFLHIFGIMWAAAIILAFTHTIAEIEDGQVIENDDESPAS